MTANIAKNHCHKWDSNHQPQVAMACQSNDLRMVLSSQMSYGGCGKYLTASRGWQRMLQYIIYNIKLVTDATAASNEWSQPMEHIKYIFYFRPGIIFSCWNKGPDQTFSSVSWRKLQNEFEKRTPFFFYWFVVQLHPRVATDITRGGVVWCVSLVRRNYNLLRGCCMWERTAEATRSTHLLLEITWLPLRMHWNLSLWCSFHLDNVVRLASFVAKVGMRPQGTSPHSIQFCKC